MAGNLHQIASQYILTCFCRTIVVIVYYKKSIQEFSTANRCDNILCFQNVRRFQQISGSNHKIGEKRNFP